MKIIDSLSQRNDTLNQFFQNQKTSCQTYGQQINNKTDLEVRQLASKLFERIKIATRVNSNDAFLAGILNIHENIPAFSYESDGDSILASAPRGFGESSPLDTTTIRKLRGHVPSSMSIPTQASVTSEISKEDTLNALNSLLLLKSPVG